MKISNEIKTGILGIIAIAIFILGYKFLRGTGVLSSKRTVQVKYNNVQGLTPSSFILLNGVKIGMVNDISFEEDDMSNIIVSMGVDKSINIPKDSRATIISDGLLGTKAIKLELGASKEYLTSEDILDGTLEVGLIDGLDAKVNPIVDKVTLTLGHLDSIMSAIQNVFDDRTQRNIKSTVASVNNSMTDINILAKELGQQKGKISGMMNNLGSFTNNLNKNNQSINNIVKNAETTTNNLAKIELQETVQNLETTLKELEKTLNKVNNGNGSMALLMNDDKLYKNVKNTMETVNNLLYDISARPKRYINFSVFGRKDKTPGPPATAPNINK